MTLYKNKIAPNPVTQQDDEVRIDEAGRFLIDNVQNLESLESSEFYPNQEVLMPSKPVFE